jgi:Bacterial Ig-like domain
MRIAHRHAKGTPVSPRLRLLGALVAALVLAGAASPAAHAGTYDVAVRTDADVSGWQFTHDPGFFGCSIKSHPGPCADGDVPTPTTLRIFAYGTAEHLANAYWEWLAPPTTTIEHGSVRVVAATSASGTYAYMKARLRSESFVGSPQLHVTPDDGAFVWSIPSGNEALGVFLKTDLDRTYSDKWKNTIRITDLTATLRDDTAPKVVLSGPLAAGSWLNQSQRVGLTVDADDAGAGVAAASLRSAGTVLDSDSVPARTGAQPGRTSYSGALGTIPSVLGDGVHVLDVVVADAAGESTTTPVTVRVDAHAPVATATSPVASTTDVRPVVSFSVDPGPSGLGTFEASLDGMPMQISGPDATLTPAADLAYGTHTVTYHASDGAGNSRDGAWSFAVVDTTPPSLTHAVPADGSSGEDRRPEIAFDLADAGTGVDAATLHVVLDGTDVAAAGTYAAGHFSLVPAASLPYGTHHVKVTARDRSGNAMPAAEWTFTVADATPPVLSDPAPRNGSSGSDRTPAVSFQLADAGIGVDPDTITLSIDGTAVAAAGSLAGGRFTYVPAAPLGFGVHTATAEASDRAGNAASALVWSFTVADEDPPVVAGRRPLPDSIVPGATAIAFDLTDAGTGVDAGTLVIDVDGSDVSSWGALSGGHFSYAPGNLGAGVHTISVTVADNAGNVAGPVVWQFAVADPATLGLAAAGGPSSIVHGHAAVLRFAATSSGTGMAGARILVSARPAGSAAFGPARVVTASATGVAELSVSPARTTAYRAELEADPSVRAERTLVVHQRVTLTASRHRMRRGGTLQLSGRVTPGRSGRGSIQLLTSRGWRTVARPKLGGRSGFHATVVAALPGRYILRAVAAATARNAGGTSASVTVRVR